MGSYQPNAYLSFHNESISLTFMGWIAGNILLRDFSIGMSNNPLMTNEPRRA